MPGCDRYLRDRFFGVYEGYAVSVPTERMLKFYQDLLKNAK